MKSKCLLFLTLMLLICFSPALQSAEGEKEKPRKNLGIGVYVGWALGLGDPFDWDSYRHMNYKEDLNFQLGVYKEFSISSLFAIQVEATMQHYYWKYRGSWGYDPREDYQDGIDSQPVFKFCLNGLLNHYFHPGFRFYFLAGAGVRTGEVGMHLYKKTNFHCQFGLGAKIRLKRKLLLNVMARFSVDPSDRAQYDIITYPNFIIGLEF